MELQDRRNDHAARAPLIGEILTRNGWIDQTELSIALTLQTRHQARLGDILRSNNLVSRGNFLAALAQQFGTRVVDLATEPPDVNVTKQLSAEFCLKHKIIPLKFEGSWMVFATANPDGFASIIDELAAKFGRVSFVIAGLEQIEAQISQLRQGDLSERANSLCPPRYSCRTWAKPMGLPVLALILMALSTIITFYPQGLIWGLTGWIILNLVMTTTLRFIALSVQIGARLGKLLGRVSPESNADWRGIDPKLPIVSVLVPLHREEHILPQLLKRLGQSDYPKDLLEVCLVLEENDHITREAARQITLPRWMRIIEVPSSSLQTKPRAMNYALDFCKGTIVGIYDAEDSPDTDQISRMVNYFSQCGPEVACIQGYLDFYNPKRNWISRCFTIEYASWFRVVMHGIQKLGLPIPLGGTTVFFRREALEALGAWDAHNVTEDADLGFRLARFGYRCAVLGTTTREEANCRPLPWIKQRSRWLKGYAMTWITHMRNPIALWRDLGPLKFMAFQVILLGTLTNFLFAPLVWSLWLIRFGLTPIYASALPWQVWWLLGWAFVITEVILFITGVFAVSGRGHRHLIPWVPTMIFYWPLATLAAYKAVFELIIKPFYWDKTQHGHLTETTTPSADS